MQGKENKSKSKSDQGSNEKSFWNSNVGNNTEKRFSWYAGSTLKNSREKYSAPGSSGASAWGSSQQLWNSNKEKRSSWYGGSTLKNSEEKYFAPGRKDDNQQSSSVSAWKRSSMFDGLALKNGQDKFGSLEAKSSRWITSRKPEKILPKYTTMENIMRIDEDPLLNSSGRAITKKSIVP